MKVAAGLSGWLCLTGLMAGLHTGEAQGSGKSPPDSVARCSFSLFAGSDSQSVAVAAEANTIAVASAHAVAEATATAFARSVAKVQAACESSGNAGFIVNGKSVAQAHAIAIAEAFAAGMVDAAVCDKCSASATFVGESFSELYLTAVAEAEFHLSGSGDASASADIFVEAVAKAVVVAFAEVLVDAKAAFDKGCDGSILGVVITGDVDDPDGVICEVTVAGLDKGFAKDAVAVAAASISDFLCGDKGRVDVIAKEVAIAVAKAVAEVTVDCEVQGNAYACAFGDADVRSVAKATATAIAELVVELNLLDTECKCEITGDAILKATEAIVSDAAASAWAGACPVLGGTFKETDLQIEIEAKIATAFAGIWAKIKTDSCSVEVKDIVASVTVCNSCVKKLRKCYFGEHEPIQGCCDEGYYCYQQNANTGRCRKPGSVPSFYVGTEPLPCD